MNRLSQVSAFWAFFVIFAGAMVTSTGSGMAVPDWPTSFGVWWPRMVGGVFYEHGHRTVAAIAGLLILVLALATQFLAARATLRRLAWYAFLAVCLQGLLGGLTVMLGTWYGWDRTSPVVSTIHACLAQGLFATLVAYAVVSARGWTRYTPTGAGAFDGRLASWSLVALVFIQIILGAVLRHQEAGLIIPDFPLNYGKLIPEFHDWRVGLNFAHRLGAYTVFLLGMLWSLKVIRHCADSWLRGPAWILAASLCLQLTLGAYTVWSGRNPTITSAHVVGGALVLISSLTLALRLTKARGVAGA